MVTVALFASVLHVIFGTLLFVFSLFLILLVLVQRGRGGGLSGAFGGMGGQSAFGTRAGDTFTYITIWASAAWIILCIAAVKLLSSQPGTLEAEETPVTQPVDTTATGQVPVPSDSSGPAAPEGSAASEGTSSTAPAGDGPSAAAPPNATGPGTTPVQEGPPSAAGSSQGENPDSGG